MAAKESSSLSTTNIMLITVLVSAVVVVGGLLIAKQLFGQLQLNQKVLSKKSAAASQLAANLVAAPKLVDTYSAQSPATHQKITDALPTSPDVPGFVAMMDRIASTSGVGLETLNPGIATPTLAPAGTSVQSGPTSVPFGATVTGSYANFLRFLINLELSARPVQLKSISVQGTTNSMSATLSLTTDYQPAPSLSLQTETVK